MKTAFLYAGQGSQHKGMGEDLYKDYPEFREVFDGVKTDFDIKELCFEDPKGELSKTQYTQPCMVAFACGVTKILNNLGIKPDILAGLSLGEYSALEASGVFSANDAVDIASFRGKVMTKSSDGVDAGMTAVMGLTRAELQECVDEASKMGVVSICNDNCPGQLVLGGERTAVAVAAELAKNRGAKRCVLLNVSGPFHTTFMAKAGDELSKYFNGTNFNEEKIPVVFNLLGRERNSDENVKDLLIGQVQNGVKMRQSINYMLDKGVRRFVEIGPGRVLTGFVKKCAKEKNIEDIECFCVETKQDVEKLAEAF